MTIMKDTLDDLINSIYSSDIGPLYAVILLKYHTLTFYIIEPYLPPKENNEPVQIPVNENYSIYDYGSHLKVAPNDIYQVPLFATSEFFLAIEQAVDMLIEAQAEQIAMIGDTRALNFSLHMCQKSNLLAKTPLKIINYEFPETFNTTLAATERYMKEHGLEPKVHMLKKLEK